MFRYFPRRTLIGKEPRDLLLGPLPLADIGNRRYKPDDFSVRVELRRVRAVHVMLANGGIRNFDLEIDSLAAQRGLDVLAKGLVRIRTDGFRQSFADKVFRL